MQKKIAAAIFFTIFVYTGVNGEIAVLPYRVNNPSVYFTSNLGVEYSKMLSIAALYKKDIDVLSYREIETDMRRQGLSSSKKITGDDLFLFGKSRYLDYILLGSLSKSGKTYISRSILYSVKNRKKILSIKVKAGNLFSLAEKEISEALMQFDDLPAESGIRMTDLAVIIDTSYNIKPYWDTVKKALVKTASRLIDFQGVDTRVNVIPFSDRSSYRLASLSVNSILSLKKNLNNIRIAGSPDSNNFVRSFRYAVKNIRWRKNARRVIVIIINSVIKKTSAVDTYAYLAGKKNIKIHSIGFGRVYGGMTEIVKRISAVTKGINRSVAYRQSVYNYKGEKIELFLENGRVFKSMASDRSWREGLFSKNYSAGVFARPKFFLDEIFYDTERIKVEPRDLSGILEKETGARIINKGKIENNFHSLLKDLILRPDGVENGGKRISGRALLYDGKVSMWAAIFGEDKARFFREKKSKGYYFPLGIIVRKGISGTYGISVIPKLININSSSIPDMMKTDLSKIIKKSNYYLNRGLYYPPLWFINVKIEKLKIFKQIYDIRD